MLARAARLSRVPGVTIAEACARFAVGKAAVTRARRTITRLSPGELALAALTSNGTVMRGTLGDLASITGDRWRLVAAWP